MKRFSQDVDREFEFGGELFKWKQPYWEDFANQIDKDMAAVNAAITNGGETEEAQRNATVHKAIQDLVTDIEIFIDPENESIKRWRALVKRKDNAVPLYQFRELHDWLYGVASGRPPTEGPSQDGQPETETTSTDASA